MMRNNWTGIQYSVFRLLLGTYLCFFFLLSDWSLSLLQIVPILNSIDLLNGPAQQSIRLLAIILSVSLGVGIFQRFAALLLGLLVVCLWQFPLPIENAALLLLSVLLFWQALLPPAPPGSLAHRARSFINYEWRIRESTFALLWISAFLTYAALALASDMSLGFLNALLIVLIIFLNLRVSQRRLSAALPVLLWFCSFLIHLFSISPAVSLNEFARLFLFYSFLFNPGWLALRFPNAKGEYIFYDGDCGLCHRWVAFVLSEESGLSTFRFAPLKSQAFARELGDLTHFADSIIVKTEQGFALQRSAAVFYILQRLGGFWGLLARILALLPLGLRDWLYDQIAGIRHQFFKKPDSACPLLPPELISRFEMS